MKGLRIHGLRRSVLLLLPALLFSSAAPAVSSRVPALAEARPTYDISLAIDYEKRSFRGTERVTWTNLDSRPAPSVYFHIYANVHSAVPRRASTGAEQSAESLAPVSEPRIEVTKVGAAPTGARLPFTLDDAGTTLRVNLAHPAAAGERVEVDLAFEGSVPEIAHDETSLLAHVTEQISAAIQHQREVRSARDINFRARDVMVLGTCFPVLATRDGDEWQRKVEATIGDSVFTDAADYRVAVEAPADVAVFTSGTASGVTATSPPGSATRRQVFEGRSMRDFAIIAGRKLRVSERRVDNLTVRSIYASDHERIGERVLAIASDAVRVYTARFGKLPYPTFSVVDAPLLAGLGSLEFGSLSVVASALYLDFDSPQAAVLPELVRQQRASIEGSLEFTVAHVAAHQWWGVAVGNNPEREPVLDEALANWSALLYYREIHNEKRAREALDDQLRGVYKIYRTFGGEDMEADREARDYQNFFQYAAIVSSKGALMFTALRELMGDDHFFAGLRAYYRVNLFEIAEMDDLRGALLAEAPPAERRQVARTFKRWLSEKHGDQDIASPDADLAASLGLPPVTANSTRGDHNAFARLGKFFWQQMTRIR